MHLWSKCLHAVLCFNNQGSSKAGKDILKQKSKTSKWLGYYFNQICSISFLYFKFGINFAILGCYLSEALCLKEFSCWHWTCRMHIGIGNRSFWTLEFSHSCFVLFLHHLRLVIITSALEITDEILKKRHKWLILTSSNKGFCLKRCNRT